MSVSSHLSPEPERRLLIMLERVVLAGERSELKLAGLVLLAAAELAWLQGRSGFMAASLLLAPILPLAVLGLSPLVAGTRPLPGLDPRPSKPSIDDNLFSVEDLVKYALGDLINRLDRYLGGGITATPYHEDLVGQIRRAARAAARKERLLVWASTLAAAGQFALLTPYWGIGR